MIAVNRDVMPKTPPTPPTPDEITGKGTAVLNGISTVNVACTAVTANSLIFTNTLVVGGVLGVVAISSRTPGVGFAVSSIALNTSTIAWLVIEP